MFLLKTLDIVDHQFRERTHSKDGLLTTAAKTLNHSKHQQYCIISLQCEANIGQEVYPDSKQVHRSPTSRISQIASDGRCKSSNNQVGRYCQVDESHRSSQRRGKTRDSWIVYEARKPAEHRTRGNGIRYPSLLNWAEC